MDEDELARRAVERRAITEEQLREARSFAEGGRSLLSVLLDLGYLRAEQLPELLETRLAPPLPLPRRAPRLLGSICLVLLSFILGWAIGPRPPRASDVLETRRQNEQLQRALARTLKEKDDLLGRVHASQQHAPSRIRSAGRAILEQAEERLREEGSLTPEIRDLFLEGTILLEAADNPLVDSEELLLARGWEVLRKWDKAYASYARLLKKNPHQPRALLGATRAALEAGDLPTALQHAGEAVQWAPSGDAHLLLGQAQMRSGRKDLARQCFLKARELDPALIPLVANLLERLPRE